MSEEPEDEHQPALTIHHISFTPGMIEGKPCVVVYDAAEDKTSVIAPQSKFYENAMAALTILAASAVPVLKPEKKTVLHARKPKLILPGSNASN